MKLPTKEEIENLLDEYHVPKNIRSHSEQVAKVAVFIAQKLKQAGEDVSVELAEAAALLHDLTRSANFENFDQPGATEEDVEFWKKLKEKHGDVHHGYSAAQVLKERYPEVAEVIEGHTIENETSKLLEASWEIRLLVYADIRVLHETIVNMGDRLNDSRKRHGWFFEKIEGKTGINYRKIIEGNLRTVEKQIFEKLDIKPEDINKI